MLGTTLCCLVEQALNSRPITPVSTDSRELEALTLNHILLGHATSFPPLLPGEHFAHTKSYVRAQSYANAFWSCWLREYVPPLNKHVKWHTQSEFTLNTLSPESLSYIMHRTVVLDPPLLRPQRMNSLDRPLSSLRFFLQGRRMLLRKCKKVYNAYKAKLIWPVGRAAKRQLSRRSAGFQSPFRRPQNKKT